MHEIPASRTLGGKKTEKGNVISLFLISTLSISDCCVFVFLKETMAEGEEMMNQEDWKEKCMVLEALLMKFRVQIIKIRELTADKVGLRELVSFHL